MLKHIIVPVISDDIECVIELEEDYGIVAASYIGDNKFLFIFHVDEKQTNREYFSYIFTNKLFIDELPKCEFIFGKDNETYFLYC